MSMQRRAGLLLDASDELEDLRLDGHVERGRGLVGDEQLRARRRGAIAIITRWRMPPDSSWGYCLTRRSG